MRNRALAIGIVANLIGGASYLVHKLALTGFPPATVSVLRTLIALPLLFAFLPRGWIRTLDRADWRRMILVGTAGLALPHLIGSYGLRDSASLNAAILIGMEPISIVLFSALLLRERITPSQIIGIAAAFLGATLIVTNGDLGSIRLDTATRGNLLLAISGALWAIYTIAGKVTLERVSPMAVTAVSSAISLSILLPASLWELTDFDPAQVSAPAIASVVALALAVSFGATLMWNVALKSITATEMGVLVFLQPMVGAMIGVLVGEPLPAALIVGAPLVFAGVYLTQFKSSAPP